MFCSGSLNRLDCHLLAQLAADDADDDAGQDRQVSTNGTAAAAGPDRQLAPLAVGEPGREKKTIIIMKGTTLRP